MISFRVDDFPFTKSEETWRHNLSNFKMFNEVMRKYHATYVLGVIPDRLTDEMLQFLSEEQVEVALHGIHHDERFPNEFHSGETEEQIYQELMSAKYRLDKFVGPVDIYIPPHNVIDSRTVDALVRAGFKTLWGGPGSSTDVLYYAASKGMSVHSFDPPFFYGRSDEMNKNDVMSRVKNEELKDEKDTVLIGLHWTWETNIGLQSLDSFLSNLFGEARCLLCKISLPEDRGNRRLYCSPVCRYDHRRIKDRGYKNPEMVVELRKIENCQICGERETSVTRQGKDELRLLSIDHDHETNIVRGILCSNCNRGIGLLKDDISILEKAIAYLQKRKNIS